MYRTGMNYCAMANGYMISDNRRQGLRIDMHNSIILNIGTLADSDIIAISAQCHIMPYGGISTNPYRTHHHSTAGDIGCFIYFWPYSQIWLNRWRVIRAGRTQLMGRGEKGTGCHHLILSEHHKVKFIGRYISYLQLFQLSSMWENLYSRM